MIADIFILILLLILIIVYIKFEIYHYNNTLGKWKKEIKEALNELYKKDIE